MSEEKRQLDNLLEEVDEFFQQHGLLTEVQAFLESEEVSTRISAAADELIANMKEMEENAPDDSVKSIANDIRSEFEENKECLAEDIFASFKVNFYHTLKLALELTDDSGMQEMFLSATKEALPKKGMADINEICTNMVEKNSNTFMRNIYREYVPAGIPADVCDFIHAFLGGPMIPIAAIFPEFAGNDAEEESDVKDEQ